MVANVNMFGMYMKLVILSKYQAQFTLRIKVCEVDSEMCELVE